MAKNFAILFQRAREPILDIGKASLHVGAKIRIDAGEILASITGGAHQFHRKIGDAASMDFLNLVLKDGLVAAVAELCYCGR
jgi:uncharacterized membrane-anchored protein